MATVLNAYQWGERRMPQNRRIRLNHTHLFALVASAVRWTATALIVFIIALPSLVSFNSFV